MKSKFLSVCEVLKNVLDKGKKIKIIKSYCYKKKDTLELSNKGVSFIGSKIFF